MIKGVRLHLKLSWTASVLISIFVCLTPKLWGAEVADLWLKYGLSQTHLEKLKTEPLGSTQNAQEQKFKFSAPQKTLEITVRSAMERREAEFFMRQESSAIKLSYQKQRIPYAGQVTTLVTCSRKYGMREKPLKRAEGLSEIIFGGVGARYNFGACVSEDISYVGFTAPLYFEAAKVYLRINGYQVFDKNKSWAGQLDGVEKWAKEIIQ